jgi:hypothetical protein
VTGHNAVSTDGPSERETHQALGVAPEGLPVSDVPLPLPGLVRCIECGGMCSQGKTGPERALCSARCRQRRSRRLRRQGSSPGGKHAGTVSQVPCEWCGRVLEVARLGQGGRPQVYHHECGAVRSALSLLQRALETQRTAGLSPTGESAKLLRRELIGMAWEAAPGRIGRKVSDG